MATWYLRGESETKVETRVHENGTTVFPIAQLIDIS